MRVKNMKIMFGFIAIMLITSMANLLMKTGIMQAAPGTPHWIAVLNWRVVFGVAGLGLAAFIYVWLLRLLPLYVVQSFGAAQFISVILVSAFVLRERIEPGQWIGITLIALGILVVAWYAR